MSARAIALAIAVSGLSLAGSALAEDPPAQGTPLNVRPSHAQEIGAPAPSLSLWTKIGLATLVAGGAALAWKMRQKNAKGPDKKRALEILARRAIGVRSEICVVETHGQTLLLGITPNTITRLAVLSTAGEADADVEPAARSSSPGPRVRQEQLARFAELGALADDDDDAFDDDEPVAPPAAKSAMRPPRPAPRAVPAPPKSDPAPVAAKRAPRAKNPATPAPRSAEEQIRGLLRRRAEGA